MVSQVGGSWTPTIYKQDGVSVATTNTVGTAAETVGATLPPATEQVFQGLVQSDTTLLVPNANGGPPADLTGSLNRLEQVAEAIVSFQNLAISPQALAAILISAMFSQETNAIQQANTASQLMEAAALAQAAQDTAAAQAIQSSALTGLVLGVFSAALDIVSGGISAGSSFGALRSLSPAEGGEEPEDDIDDDPATATNPSKTDDNTLVPLDDPSTPTSTNATNQNDVDDMGDELDETETLETIDARQKAYQGVSQMVKGLGEIFQALQQYEVSQGQATSQIDQAQGQIDAAQQQIDTQFYNYWVGVSQTTQQFVGAVIEQLAGILTAQAQEGAGVNQAKAGF